MLHARFALAASAIASVSATPVADDGSAMSVVVNADGSFSIQQRDESLGATFLQNEAAWGRWNDTYATLGWSMLEVHGNPAVADDIAAGAAGYFEGKATAVRIEQNAVNSGVPTYEMKPAVKDYLATNAKWQASMISLARTEPPKSADRVYWHQVDMLNTQLDGVYQGYSAARAEMEQAAHVAPAPLSKGDILLLNLGGDLEDLDGIDEYCSGAAGAGAGNSSTPRAPEGTSPEYNAGRCSSLVRLTEGNQDVFFAQNTWASLNSMIRVYKLYDLPFSTDGHNASGAVERVAAPKVSFSSYPGTLYSGDDFYVVSSGMAVLETTIGNGNRQLACDFIQPLTLLEWQRNVVANRLASRGVDWCGIYQKVRRA